MDDLGHVLTVEDSRVVLVVGQEEHVLGPQRICQTTGCQTSKIRMAVLVLVRITDTNRTVLLGYKCYGRIRCSETDYLPGLSYRT